MLQINNFYKAYNQRKILAFDRLELSPGLYWFKGVNGSGKSTLFKVISGMIPFDGSILFDGVDLKREPVKYRSLVSYSEAEPLFPEFLSLNDLAEFTAKVKKADPGTVERLITVLQAGNFRHQPSGTYSSGMLKKTGLLLALIGNPKLLILDEPFITIDTSTIERLNQLILEALAQEITILISSHIHAEEIRLPENRIYQLENQTLNLKDTHDLLPG